MQIIIDIISNISLVAFPLCIVYLLGCDIHKYMDSIKHKFELFEKHTHKLINATHYNDYFIKVYQNALSDEVCDEIIKQFEKSEIYDGVTAGGCNHNIKKTKDFHLSHGKIEDWKEIDTALYSSLTTHLQRYYAETQLRPMENLEDTGFQIQRYRKNDGHYVMHHDASREFDKYRVLTFLWYLNDVHEGGETNFYNKIWVKPKKGQLVLFPATWNHEHMGCMPISNDKYIVTGWIYTREMYVNMPEEVKFYLDQEKNRQDRQRLNENTESINNEVNNKSTEMETEMETEVEEEI